MDADLQQRLERLEKKIDDVFISAERSRKYLLTIVIVTVVALVLPLIGLVFAVPTFLSTYSSIGGL